ncbi:hypothetical protein SDRG_16710 [Saprolegnia diclina VS20]|uniref:Calponin-homology (CH) domain-containing protein n=1 Tax=Saprolegnia diclina (strain VS20) TaxID=1156394 RepID=T0R7F5_SAPDV|nr:hypothetical protein SDRG_16710 [Saprolegnia diclina VS20]EQC25422.1 hypothetical protein SDRG_16710 [Saprolegnia diclina VS20]|eukprot:XP_008621150.1 hypothetical protein SDRG_16710 [Saprolegnia diclina VS20]
MHRRDAPTGPQRFVSLRGGNQRVILLPRRSSSRASIAKSEPLAPDSPPATPLKPRSTSYVREDLVRTHLSRPKISLKQLQQFLLWLNLLSLWPHKLHVESYHDELRNGVFLSHLLHHYVPDFSIGRINQRAQSQRTTESNVELLLQCLSRFNLNVRNVPSAAQLWSGDRPITAAFLHEIFHKVVLRSLSHKVVWTWCQDILSLYHQASPHEVWSDSLLSDISNNNSSSTSGLFDYFRSGFRLWCVLHYYGARRRHDDREDIFQASTMFMTPTTPTQHLANAQRVCGILAAMQIPLVWEPDWFVSHKSNGFMQLQLHYIYQALHHSAPALTNDMTEPVYLDVSANGRVGVHGLLFADGECKEPENTWRASAAGSDDEGSIDDPLCLEETLVQEESPSIFEQQWSGNQRTEITWPPEPSTPALDEYAQMKERISLEELSRMEVEEAYGVVR